MQFPQRDLTNQFISTSYQDVVQRFSTGSVDYLLDGYGFTLLGIPTNSIGGIVLTQDQTASFANTASFALNTIPQISSSWASASFTSISSSYARASDLAQIADVALMADTASISVDSINSISASWASSSYTSSWAHSVRQSAGSTVVPSIVTNDISGTITVGNGYANFFIDSTQQTAENFFITGGVFNLTTASPYIVTANYNNGNPVYQLVADPTTIDEIQTVPVFTVGWADFGKVMYFDWHRLGTALSNKIHRRLTSTELFARQSGLSLGISGSRYVTISSGIVWFGAIDISLNTFNSFQSSSLRFYYHSGSQWTSSWINQYDNTHYDDGTNLQLLGNNKFNVNYIYRSSGSYAAALLSNAQYNTILSAQDDPVPVSVPPFIQNGAVLVGRIIAQQNSNTASLIQSAFENTFVLSPTINHNDLNNIQGGTTNEYYHLTSAEYTGTGTGIFVRQNNSVITASLLGTASYANNATSTSYAPPSISSSWSSQSLSSSVSVTASFALTAGSVSSTSSSYLSGSSGSLNILNLFPPATSSAVIKVNALINSTSSYSIGNGTWINFPVPYIRGNSNTPIAFDVMPGGGGQNTVSIDLSDTDVVANNAANYETLHLVKNPAGEAVIATHAKGTGTVRSLVLQDASGSIGFNTLPSEQYHAKFDQNARTTFALENANTGSTGHSTIEARTDSTNTRYLRLVSTGTGFTSNGAFGQDGGALELGPSKSGSLSILTRTTASAIVFYQGGFSSVNEQFRIAAPTGRIGVGGIPNPVNSMDVDGNISCSVVTASLFFGTASFANNAMSASYAPSVSSSFASTASYVLLNGNVNTLPISNVIYVSSSFVNLNDFTFVNLTASIVSNAIRFPTGAGDWTQYMMLSNPINMDGNWELEVTYTPNTTVSFGLGIGRISVSSQTFFPMQIRGQLWASSSHMYIANNTSTNVVDVIDSGFNNTFPGDTIVLRFKQSNNVLSLNAKNVTSGYSRTIIYKDPLLANTGSNLQFMSNTGRFTIWNPNAAGTIDIKSIKVTSFTPQLPFLSIVGDSKVVYSSGDFKSAFPQLLSSQYFTPIVPYLGPGDRTGEISQSIDYLINNIKPKNVMLLMGRNDVLSNVTASVWQPNYKYVVNTLLTASIGVTHILPIPESSSVAVNTSQSLLRTFIINTYGYDKCIDVTANFNTNSMISSDTVHPNATGHQWIADSILGSGLLKQS